MNRRRDEDRRLTNRDGFHPELTQQIKRDAQESGNAHLADFFAEKVVYKLEARMWAIQRQNDAQQKQLAELYSENKEQAARIRDLELKSISESGVHKILENKAGKFAYDWAKWLIRAVGAAALGLFAYYWKKWTAE
jgi:ubiquinone biosynthesis protein UbiJ